MWNHTAIWRVIDRFAHGEGAVWRGLVIRVGWSSWNGMIARSAGRRAENGQAENNVAGKRVPQLAPRDWDMGYGLRGCMSNLSPTQNPMQRGVGLVK